MATDSYKESGLLKAREHALFAVVCVRLPAMHANSILLRTVRRITLNILDHFSIYQLLS